MTQFVRRPASIRTDFLSFLSLARGRFLEVIGGWATRPSAARYFSRITFGCFFTRFAYTEKTAWIASTSGR